MSSTSKVNAALASAIVFLFLSSLAAYFAFGRMRASEAWVQHTRDVEASLEQFANMSTRAARMRAEYVDSGDATVLQRESQSVADVRHALASLHRLISENASQQDSFRQLADLTERRLALIHQSIQLKQLGKSTLETQAPIVRQITAVAEATDDSLQSLYAQEQQLLKERQQRAQSSFTIMAGILASSLFLALILFLIHHQLLTGQVQERLRAESAMRALSARLLTLQDEERRKFARELHDSVGQHLAAIKMAISLLSEKLPGDPTLQDCLKLADDSISETRTISHLLHPPLLDEVGLASAVRWFVEGFGKRSGIQVHLDLQQDGKRLPPSVELVLFRVLQESLTNVHRHSGAQRAEVSLSIAGNNVSLRVKDDGRGMSPAMLHSLQVDGTGVGVGLAGMTQRIREIGGQLEIRSTSGTEIIASIPLGNEAPRERISPREAQAVNR